MYSHFQRSQQHYIVYLFWNLSKVVDEGNGGIPLPVLPQRLPLLFHLPTYTCQKYCGTGGQLGRRGHPKCAEDEEGGWGGMIQGMWRCNKLICVGVCGGVCSGCVGGCVAVCTCCLCRCVYVHVCVTCGMCVCCMGCVWMGE